MERKRLSVVHQDSDFWEEEPALDKDSMRDARYTLRPPLIMLNSSATLVNPVDEVKEDRDGYDEAKPSASDPLRTSPHQSHHPHLHLPHHIHIPHPHVHVHLPRPFLPTIHLILLCTHLGLAMTLPYTLVTNLIQPMVLWLITLIPALLQALYLLIGIIMEIIGLVRSRPIAWLQSGVHLTIAILSVLPPSLAIAILSIAHQLPACTSTWSYTAPSAINFPTYTPQTACHALPRAMLIALTSIIVILLDIALTGTVIGIDYRQRLQEQSRARDVAGMKRDEIQERLRSREIIGRRWASGVGELLWDIEGRIHRR